MDAACAEAGICRRTYYDWFERQPEFAAWWRDEASAFFTRQLPRVLSAMHKAATGDDLPGGSDRKLFLERFDRDYVPKRREELSAPGGGPVVIFQETRDAGGEAAKNGG